MVVRGLLQSAAERLKEAGVDTPILDAEVMLSRTLNRTRTELLAHPESRVPSESVEKFLQWTARRSAREPLAYIIGEREFFGLSFHVTRDVLIPRPETETLVETALADLDGVTAPIIADIGVGSGAVAVSIARARPDAAVYGTEFSAAALEIARTNTVRLGLGKQVTLLRGDLLSPLEGLLFDVVVSNPPYVPSAEISRLQPEVAMYEPAEALDGGPDGLDCHRRLAAEAPAYLKPGGLLAVEVGMGQADAVEELFRSNCFLNVRSVRDLSRIPRVVSGIKS